MPSISTIQAGIAELPKGPPIVAAFAGGTTGIGSYIVKALATVFANKGDRLRIYIIGRNAERGNAVISECSKISPGSDWRFVKSPDLSLISEVDKCCTEIARLETESPFHGGPPRLDLLYMSHSHPIVGNRTTTAEGLDALESTLYYSRVRFVTKLAPLLSASPRAGHAVSVYLGAKERGVTTDAYIGRTPDEKYGVVEVGRYLGFMKTMVFEDLAEKYAGKIRFTHIFPGLVDGPGFDQLPRVYRILWTLLKPIAWIWMTPPEDCGAVMVYLATDRFPAKGAAKDGADVVRASSGERGGGSYSLGQLADAPPQQVLYEKARKEDTHKKAWDYTMNLLDDIEKRNLARG
ncbi:hypothetical protein B0I35DRAFT_427166 [Stachybotrys elegans]|uniref:Ketoreductase (KR) domain-containing protein n=1 Tax=Stachybotrys elegans TaxID=80388 RepID=A0A8K0SV52_9HYPO|nr:hypothetical protein B0I35DRAFT_427166 [Stachybotrys elegans]